MIKKYIIYIAFLVFAVSYSFFLFSKFPNDKFLFIGDQFFRFSKEEINENAFYIRKLENFGVFNAWQLTVQTPEILYYTTVYNIGLTPRQAEQLLFALIIFITLSLSYYSFNRLKEIFSPRANDWLVLAIAVWYSMNPYLMVLWHGATYNFGSSLTYSLAPLILYYFHKSIIDFTASKSRLICAVLMFLASFTFWMFAAYIFFLAMYFVLYLCFNRKMIGVAVINLLKLGLLYLPLCAIMIYPLLHENFNNNADVNGAFAPMFTQIKGGMLYQFLMYFSWGIYNYWTPRSIYPESITNFYFSPFYIGSTVSLYALLLIPIVNKFRNKSDEKLSRIVNRNFFIAIFALIFIVSIFLGKGPTNPFGQIFIFLYNHFPFFNVFRSSDYRFGFTSVLALSLLFLIVLPHIKKVKYAAILLFLLTFIQNYIFFDTSLIIGQNKQPDFTDRVVTIPQDYKELKDFFDNDKETSYIYADPSVEFGTYNLGVDEKHTGQDLLPKIIDQPMAYIPVTTGMSIPTAQVLYTALVNKQFELLKLLPLKYIVLRNDTVCVDCALIESEDIKDGFTELFSNNTFKVLGIYDHTPLIRSSDTSVVTYDIVSPVEYKVSMVGMTGPAILSLLQSNSSNWSVYLNKYEEPLCENIVRVNGTTYQCERTKHLLNLRNLQLPSNVKISGKTYSQNLNHMNSWEIDPAYISTSYDQSYSQKNENGTYDLLLTIYYNPQTSYMRYAALSIILLISYIVLIAFNDKYFKIRL